jgi:hypothetical protein
VETAGSESAEDITNSSSEGSPVRTAQNGLTESPPTLKLDDDVRKDLAVDEMDDDDGEGECEEITIHFNPKDSALEALAKLGE